MSKDIKNKINEAIFNFYMEADKDIIQDSIKENVANPDEYAKKKKRILFLTKAAAKQKHNEHLLQLVNKFQEAVRMNIEKPISVLKQMIQSNPSFALYRSLDKLSNDDIIEIIKDKNLVDLLEQLDENEKKH